MLGRLFSTSLTVGRTQFRNSFTRGLSSSDSHGNEKKGKDPSIKDILGADILDAVDSVAGSLHPGNPEEKKRSSNTLISKLMKNEKKTFENATKSQTEEMLSSTSMQNLIKGVTVDPTTVKPMKASAQRQVKQGLVKLRNEIEYRAVQDGYSATEAKLISERVVNEAQERLANERRISSAQQRELNVEEKERSEKEQKLFERALQKAEEILYKEDTEIGSVSRKVLRIDPKAPSLFNTTQKLGIFGNLEGCQDKSLGFWSEWDRKAAVVANQSMGPENSFEEQIEWTEGGKQWPYPIDNEYLLGEEETVSFFEHVFLERHLARLGLPRDGPIGHFMELISVGLSKNPYMTATKKIEHLEWFGNYFNQEKQKLVHKLHEQEVQAAANA